MKTEHKIGLGLAAIAFGGGVVFASEENSGHQSSVEEWFRLDQRSLTLVLGTPTPRAIPTLIPQIPRPNPISTRVSAPTSLPERVVVSTPTFIPDVKYPKYTPEPLVSRLNEPGSLPINPLYVGVGIGSTVFLSGIGFCTIIRGMCRLISNK